jgi:hypothetical protein
MTCAAMFHTPRHILAQDGTTAVGATVTFSEHTRTIPVAARCPSGACAAIPVPKATARNERDRRRKPRFMRSWKRGVGVPSLFLTITWRKQLR